jgi:hypothetical protein
VVNPRSHYKVSLERRVLVQLVQVQVYAVGFAFQVARHGIAHAAALLANPLALVAGKRVEKVTDIPKAAVAPKELHAAAPARRPVKAQRHPVV